MNEPSRSRVQLLLWCALCAALGVAGLAGVRSLLTRGGPESARVGGGSAEASLGAGSRSGGSALASSRGIALDAPGAAGSSGQDGIASTLETGPGTGSSGIQVGDPAPEFSLTDRTGRTVTSTDLRGKVWIANFIFTRCGTTCPTLTREMNQARGILAERGADDILSVSFTIDPLYDKPEVLNQYAEGFHADPSAWLFLTGDAADMVRVVRGGFHLMINDPGDGPPMHSNRFVLVDARGRVRSSHLGTEDGVVDAIVKDALALREEARKQAPGLTNLRVWGVPVVAISSPAILASGGSSSPSNS